MGDWAAILHQTKAVLKLQPQNAKANYKMGQALDKLGKKEKALGYVESSIKELSGDQIAQDYYLALKEEVRLIQQQKTAEETPDQNTHQPLPQHKHKHYKSELDDQLQQTGEDNTPEV